MCLSATQSSREYNKKHHTSLCHMSLYYQHSATTGGTLPDQTLTIMTSTSLSAFYMNVCLLITAIEDISAGQITVEGHLFDEEV